MKRIYTKVTIISYLFSLIFCFSLILTVKDGQVAAYDSEKAAWTYLSDVPLCSLPPDAQEALHRGIILTDEANYTKTVEDFCS